jgi:hypothetical protein
MYKVLIKKGVWRKQPIVDQLFDLHQPFKAKFKGGSAGHVIVVGTQSNGLDNANCRVSCDVTDIEYQDMEGNVIDIFAELDSQVSVNREPVTPTLNYEKLYFDMESEEDAIIRIRHTFDMFEEIVDSVPKGHIRGLIVSGPPGIGKTYTVEEVMYKHFGYSENKYAIVKGHASPMAIYKTLYKYSAEGRVIVFDDCDDAFNNEIALNLLKAALDSGERRNISWLSDAASLKVEDIPDRFEFKGNVIFLTNTDFERSTVSKLRPHFDAMMSRCHYLDLEMGSQRDQLLRIKMVVKDGLLSKYKLSDMEQAMLLDFVGTNFNFLREHSLRMVTKIADIYRSNPRNWVSFVENTCLRKQFRYERLYKQKMKDDVSMVELPAEDIFNLEVDTIKVGG